MDVDASRGRLLARDGAELAFRQIGDGRPLVVLHGFIGDGRQWVDHGHAAALAERGHRVIVPDLRGHGASARPHDAAAYPPDVLADDGLSLVESLALDDYDLAGYSLGGRVAMRMLVRGARPGRAVIAGQGIDATRPATDRTGRYRRLLSALADATPPEPEDRALVDEIARSGADPHALLLVLDSLVGTTLEALGQITVPTLVLIGEQDSRASADALALTIPGARIVRVPGAHDAFLRPEFIAEIFDFLRPAARSGVLAAPARHRGREGQFKQRPLPHDTSV